MAPTSACFFFFVVVVFFCAEIHLLRGEIHLLEYVPFRLNVWWTRRAIQTLHEENMISRGDLMTE